MASIVLHATPFYNSKISIPNGSASLFKEDDFSLKKRLSPKKTDFQGSYKLFIS